VGPTLLQQNLQAPPELPEPPATALTPVPAPLDVPTLQRVASAATAPTRGEPRAPVTLVLFSNFASPYAKNVASTLQKVQVFYGPKVRLVHRTLLLEGLEDGRAAARAALAAHQQGRFWEMHDLLFSGRGLDRDSLLGYARELKLVEDRFRADMESDKVEAALQADQAEAQGLGVRALPTVFVNGEPLLGDQALDSYKALIDQKLGETPKPSAEPKKDGKKK
jgi:protein-disulfide isomerase